MKIIEDLVSKIGNVDFELTYLCNLDCLHCYNPTHTKTYELETDKVKSITKEIKDVGFSEIHFNGGEPLIRSDIYDILQYSNNIGLLTILETNGILFKEVEDLTSLKNLHIRGSIDGCEEDHNKIRKTKNFVKNPYRTSLNNFSSLYRKGIPVQITCSVNRINYKGILRMVKDVNEYGLRDIRLRLTMPTGHANKNWSQLELDKKHLDILSTQVETVKKEFPNINFHYETIKRNVPQFEPKFFINPEGKVKPYPFIDYYVGDLKQESIRDVLKKIPEAKFPKEEQEKIESYLIKLGMCDKSES